MANDKPIIDEMFRHGAPPSAKVGGPTSPLGQMWRRKAAGRREDRQETQERFDCRAW
jgi:hypothetical protein